MKAIKMILGLTIVMSVIIAIMLAPSSIMAYFVYELSQTMFLILLLPCSAFGFLLGFALMIEAEETKLFKNLFK